MDKIIITIRGLYKYFGYSYPVVDQTRTSNGQLCYWTIKRKYNKADRDKFIEPAKLLNFLLELKFSMARFRHLHYCHKKFNSINK